MLKKITVLMVLCISFWPVPLKAQSKNDSLCSTDAEFRAFDFWVGEWQVVEGPDKKIAGTNSITSIEDNCALFEQWTSQEGSSGISINHYNPVIKQWRQLWVSAGAYSIDIVGGMNNGSMILEGTIWYYRSNTSFPFKGTWAPNPDQTVRQLFEQFDPEKKSWSVWFDGTYIRK